VDERNLEACENILRIFDQLMEIFDRKAENSYGKDYGGLRRADEGMPYF